MNDVDTFSQANAFSLAKSDGSRHRSKDKDSSVGARSGKKHADIDERDKNRDRDRHREDRSDQYGKIDHRKSSGDYTGYHSPVSEDSGGQ